MAMDLNASKTQYTTEQIKILVTPQISEFLDKVRHMHTTDCNSTKEEELQEGGKVDRQYSVPEGAETSIDLDLLLQWVTAYNKGVEDSKSSEQTKVYLNKLLAGSNIVDRQKVVYGYEESAVERIRKRAEERRYQRSLKRCFPVKQQEPFSPFSLHSSSAAFSVNLLLGVILTFLAGFWGLPYAGVENVVKRTIFGFLLAFVCLLAEISLFLIRDSRSTWSAERKGSAVSNGSLEITKSNFKSVLLASHDAAVKNKRLKSREKTHFDESPNVDTADTSQTISAMKEPPFSETVELLEQTNGKMQEKQIGECLRRRFPQH